MKNLKVEIKYYFYGIAIGFLCMLALQVIYRHIIYRSLDMISNVSNNLCIFLLYILIGVLLFGIINLERNDSAPKNLLEKYKESSYIMDS